VTRSFGDVIGEVVADFLETALVVDDEAHLRAPASHGDPTEHAPGSSPQDSDETRAGSAPSETSDDKPAGGGRGDLSLEVPSAEQLAEAEREHPLVAKELIDAFADAGIVCSVLAFAKGDPIEDRFLRAAARADLLIIDWELYRDGGETARTLISAVVKQDADAARKRLRVIAIYTGQPGLVPIVEEIRLHLSFSENAVQDAGLSLAQDNLRITAFNKPLKERNPRPEIAEREVREDQLPARLVSEFAYLTTGLVPAVALASLAAIRNDTHRILQALSPRMDVGYLGHRVALPFPEDAEGHLVDMIVAEIGSVVGENDVGRWANAEKIREWLAVECAADDALVCGNALPFEAKFELAAMEKLVEIGLGRDEELKTHTARGIGEKILKRVRKQASHLFARDAASAERSTDLLAMRLAIRTVYTRPTRRLRLGTIVWHEDAYLVCVQPRCDSVRIPEGEARGFPFLPLKVVDAKPDTPRDFVIRDAHSEDLISLKLTTKPYALFIYPFLGGDHLFVEAKRRSDDRWHFEGADDRMFSWVAELKPEFAHRVAVELANDAMRVGLAEAELIRLSRPVAAS
jgi:Response receiver domain